MPDGPTFSMRSCILLSHPYVLLVARKRNLSPLNFDHASLYVVYVDSYDTLTHIGTTVVVGTGVLVQFVGTGVV
jgi:hypothetical protein